MKSVKRIINLSAAIFTAACLMFTGCNPDADSGQNNTEDLEETIEYLSSGDEITVNAGETITVYAKGKTAAEFTETEGLTITAKDGDAFEITAADTIADSAITVNFNDGTDEDDGIDVTLNVYNPYFMLTITLDEDVAENAESVTVYAEGKEDGESTAALSQTVTASYTAGETTATAKLEKAKATSYNWFNNITVTVKDSEGNEIDVEVSPTFFCYSATSGDGYLDEEGIKIRFAVSEKTFTINFEGFTIAGGKVEGLKYSTKWADSSSEWDEDYVVSPEVTVATDGASATFEVSNTSEFYIDWTAVVVKDSEDNEIVISSGNTESNKWYSYSGDVWSNTLTYVSGEYVNLVTDKEFSDLDSDYLQIVEASEFEELDISTLKVVVILTSADDGQWWASASSASSWATDTYQSLSWSESDGGYAGIITSSTFIEALKTNGLYLNLNTSTEGIVSVSYISSDN